MIIIKKNVGLEEWMSFVKWELRRESCVHNGTTSCMHLITKELAVSILFALHKKSLNVNFSLPFWLHLSYNN